MSDTRISAITYKACALGAGGIALISLVGDFLAQSDPNGHANLAALALSSTLCFLMASAAMLSRLRTKRLTIYLGTVILLSGAVSLAQYIQGADYGLDDAVAAFLNWPVSVFGEDLAPNIGAAFLLAGIGLILTATKKQTNGRLMLIIAMIGSVVAALGVVPLLSRLIDVSTTYGFGQATLMAVPTAISFTLLGIGLTAYVHRETKKLSWLPISIFVGFSVLSLCLAGAVRSQENAKLALLVQSEASDISERIDVQINGMFQGFDRMSRRWNLAGGIALPLWEDDAQAYIDHFTPLGSVAIADSESAIIDVMPKSSNSIAVGFKLSSEPSRAALVDRVRASGQAHASHVILLKSGSLGFLYAHPLNTNNAYSGILLASIRVDQFFEVVLGPDDRQNFAVTISEDDRPVFTSLPLSKNVADLWHGVEINNHHDLNWKIEVRPSAEFVTAHSSNVFVAVFLTGLITAFLMAGCAYLALRFRGQSRSLTESKSLNNAVLANAGSCIIACDTAGTVIVFNREAERMLGYGADEVVGKETPALWHDPEEIEERARELSKEFGASFEPGFSVFKTRATRDGAETSEWTFIHRDGHPFTVRLTITPLRGDNGAITGFMGIGHDVTAQKAQQAALQKSVAFNNAILSNAGSFIIACGLEGEVLVFNREAERLLGYKAEEVIGRLSPAIWHDPQEVQEAADHLTKLTGKYVSPVDAMAFRPLRDGSETREWTYVHKDGRRFRVHLTITLLRGRDGEPTGFIGVGQDITLQKLQQEALLKSEMLNNAILSNAGYSIVVTNPEGKVLVFNREAQRLLGYTADEIIGKQTPALWHTAEQITAHAEEASLEAAREVLPGMDAFSYRPLRDGFETREWDFIHKDGHRFPVVLTVTPLLNENGSPFGYIGIGRDISSVKSQQQALKISEETFRAAMENASTGMALVSTKGEWLRVNRSLCHMLGYTAEELMNLNVRTVTHPADMEDTVSSLLNLVSGRVQNFELTKRYLRKDGETVWGLLNVSCVRNPDGTPNYLVSQIVNITRQKEAQAALEASEQTFRAAMDNASTGMGLLDNSGRWLRVNKAFGDMLGYTTQEMMVMNYKVVTHPDDVEETAQKVRDIHAGKSDRFEQTKRYIHKDGRILWGLLNISVVRNPDGSPNYLISQVVNITHQREALAALKTSEETFRAAMENASTGMALTDPTGKWLRVNKSFGDMLGYTTDELLDATYRLVTHTEDIEESAQKVQEIVSGKINFFELTKRYLHKDGRIIWGILNVSVVRNPDGTAKYLVSQIVNITRQKEALAALEQSEEKFRAAMENSAIGMALGSPDGRWLRVNNSFAVMLGYEANELEQMTVQEITHPDDLFSTLKNIDGIMSGKKAAYEAEKRYLHKNGQTVWVLVNGSVVHHLDGTPNYAVVQIRDITLQKQQQSALKTSEETFRAAMENASIGMALVTPDGKWMRVNKALCELLGYTASEFTQLDIRIVTHPDDIESSALNVKKILSGEIKTYEAEKRYIRKDGRIIWVLLNVSIVHHADGSVNYLIAQINDISQRKEMDGLKDDFVSVVSHELRTPLTSIRGSLGLISGALSKDISPQVSRLIDIAHKNSERLILLINDILDMDKIAAGKMRLEMKKQYVAPLLKQAVEANTAYAEKYAVTIDLAPVDADLSINVDPDRFMQAISNLLSNAAKFSPQQSHINVVTTAKLGTIRMTVTDYGPGIPDEFKSKIFGKFLQADSSVRREKGGTGLGLHITREIILQMGGQIGFDSTHGQGASFWIEFPDINYVAPKNSMKGHILICEDDKNVATIMQMQIEDMGFTTDISYSIEDARWKLQTKNYMAMTLDIGFPKENGVDFINELRSHSATKDLPIVVVSAEAEEGRRLTGDAVGVIDWLTKPLSEERLIEALDRAGHVTHSTKMRILHVEDDRDLSHVLANALSGRAEIINAATLKDAKRRLRNEAFSLVIIDIAMPDGNGLTLLGNPDDCRSFPVPVIILSADEAPQIVQERVSASLIKSRMSETKIVETILSLIPAFKGTDHDE